MMSPKISPQPNLYSVLLIEAYLYRSLLRTVVPVLQHHRMILTIT